MCQSEGALSIDGAAGRFDEYDFSGELEAGCRARVESEQRCIWSICELLCKCEALMTDLCVFWEATDVQE